MVWLVVLAISHETDTCLVQNPDIYKRAELQRSINQFGPVCRNYVFCPFWYSSLCSVSFASSLLLLPLFLLVFFCSSVSRVFFVLVAPLQFLFPFCNVIALIASLSAARKTLDPGAQQEWVRRARPPPTAPVKGGREQTIRATMEGCVGR